MVRRDQFRKLLQIAKQIGAEKVANMDIIPSIKSDFSYGIYGELKDEIECTIPISELTETEKDAIIFAFCNGWTNEVYNRKQF